MNDTKKEIESESVWTPSSWRSYKISQQPEYKDQEAVDKIIDKVNYISSI